MAGPVEKREVRVAVQLGIDRLPRPRPAPGHAPAATSSAGRAGEKTSAGAGPGTAPGQADPAADHGRPSPSVGPPTSGASGPQDVWTVTGLLPRQLSRRSGGAGGRDRSAG